MKLPSGIESLVIKPIGTIVGPGALVLTLILFPFVSRSPGFAQFIKEDSGLFGFYALIASILLGFIVENIGSEIETLISSKVSGDEEAEEWYDYLATAKDDETVGFRYISTIVVRLKIELALIVVSGFSLLAFAVYKWLLCIDLPYVVLGLVSLVVFGYSTYEAQAGIKLLNRTRKEVLKRIKKT